MEGDGSLVAKRTIARVLLPLPIDRAFDFLIPSELIAAELGSEGFIHTGLGPQVAVGRRVKVQFRGKACSGVIVALATESEHEGSLEPVLEVPAMPSFSAAALAFCTRIASDHLAPCGLFVNRLLPQRISDKKGRSYTLAGEVSELLPHLETLSCRAPRQAAVLQQLLSASAPCSEADLRKGRGSVRTTLQRLVDKGLIRETAGRNVVRREEHALPPPWAVQLGESLPHGGQRLLFAQERWNGYAHLLNATIVSGKTALVLAPEIFLVRQLHSYLRERVETGIDLYHSALPEGERGRVWESARRGESRLIVGTRSALFLPLDDLGLLIVDEEQDRSYKQDEMLPHYHACTVAEARGEGAFLLFGSAAPSLERFHQTVSGRLRLIRPEVPARQISVQIVERKREKEVLSNGLLAAIERTLDRGRQALIAVNRRGYFQAVLCKGCGRPLRCSVCTVNLTYEVRAAQLICRVCGAAQSRMVCPECGSRALRFVGVGSARVEEEMRERFPTARIARIDIDSLQTRAHREAAEQALAGEGDILIATPMIAKGPVLPRLGLVGAIGVDALLALPDFRAAERTYQYLTGLLGRLPAGAEALIETSYPDHIAVRTAACGDYDNFYEMEAAERQALFYPPFSHLARLTLTARTARERRANGERLVSLLQGDEVEILGPAPHPTKRACTLVLLKGLTRERLRTACAAAQQEIPQLKIDLDPERI